MIKLFFIPLQNYLIEMKVDHKMMKEHKSNNVLTKVFWFYVDGFRSMTIGKTLWIIIFIKLFIMFAVLRVFFFKPVLSGKTDTQKEEFVAQELIERGCNQTASN